ncbi:MAG: prolipoprotein diacylglyceryl transferase [Lentisphaeria bacterium]|nr:prolipoprotein diacylglyceryl transferase [Lentisphaeria bacterium]
MHSIAFNFFGRPIHWYGICIAAGFLAALCILQYKRNYARMDKEQIFDIALIAIFGGIGGARLFYVIQFFHQFSGNLWNVFRIDQGGLVFYGGFLTALVILFIYAKIKKLSFARILDMYAPAIAIGHAFGRVGCFLQGCCFGKPCSWGVVYPGNSAPAERFPDYLSPVKNVIEGIPSIPLAPVQLIEAAGNIVLCVFLLKLFKYVKKTGQIAAAYFAMYGIMRFLLEFFRGDHTDTILGVTPSQFIGLFIMLPCGLICYLCFGKYGKDAVTNEDLKGAFTFHFFNRKKDAAE